MGLDNERPKNEYIKASKIAYNMLSKSIIYLRVVIIILIKFMRWHQTFNVVLKDEVVLS